MHTIAGLCAYSLINLLPGGHTNATGNSAARGGAAALIDATLIVQPGHTLTAQPNVAQSHGGAFALIEGAVLALLEAAACPTQCVSSWRGDGYCSVDCMSLRCNWDDGDCVTQRMDAAGAEAGQACDRGAVQHLSADQRRKQSIWVLGWLLHSRVRLEPRALRGAPRQRACVPAHRCGGLCVHQDGAAVLPNHKCARPLCLESL